MTPPQGADTREQANRRELMLLIGSAVVACLILALLGTATAWMSTRNAQQVAQPAATAAAQGATQAAATPTLSATPTPLLLPSPTPIVIAGTPLPSKADLLGLSGGSAAEGDPAATLSTITLVRYRLDAPSDDPDIRAGQDLLASGLYPDALDAFTRAVRNRPDVTAYLGRGWSNYHMHEYDAAESDFERAIQLDGSSAAVHFAYGELLYRTERYEEAQAEFRAALLIDPDYAAAVDGLGRSLRQLGDPVAALDQYERAMQLDPADPWPWNSRGYLRNLEGDSEGALADFTRAIELDPFFSFPYLNRSLIYLDQGLLDEAVADAYAAITTDPWDAGGFNNLGVIFENGYEDYALAFEAYSLAIYVEPDDPYSRGNRCHLLREYGYLDEAEDDCRIALEKDPDNPFVLFEMALIYIHLQRYNDALVYQNHLMEVDEPRSEEYTNRCIIYRGLEDYPEAMADCNQAVELDPGNAYAWYARGQIYADYGEWERAIEDYDEAVAISRFPAVLADRGYCHLQLEAYSAARADLEEALFWIPNYYSALVILAMVERETGNFERGLELADTALDVAPEDGYAYFVRGTIYVEMGQYEAALADFEETFNKAWWWIDLYYYRGRAYQGLGLINEAIFDYEYFLSEWPYDDDLRADAEARLDALN